jgi:hypothetical protein
MFAELAANTNSKKAVGECGLTTLTKKTTGKTFDSFYLGYYE